MKARTKALLIAAKEADLLKPFTCYLCNSLMFQETQDAEDAKVLLEQLYQHDSDIHEDMQYAAGFFGGHRYPECQEHRVMAACFAAAYSETEE